MDSTMVAVTPEDYALAETVVHASNIVSHDGYYEVDIDRAAQAIARHQSGRTGAGGTIPADHPLAKGLRTSQKALDEIKRQEQANIAGYLAMRDMPIGSVAAVALHQSGRTGAGEALLRDALENYMFAEEIDDEGVRQAELAIARQYARAALSQNTAGEDVT